MTREPDRSQRKALGKGLSALLPGRGTANTPAPFSEPQPAVAPIAAPAARQPLPENFEEFQSIPLDQIQPNQAQPRTAFDDEKLQELAQSIRSNGLLQPITVNRTGANQYHLIAGERRWRAARIAGLTEIPALVRSAEQQQILELALIENIQREDLNPIEIANAFQVLANQHGLSHEQIAERTGKDRSTVTNLLRLLRLSEFARNSLTGNQISMGHARALLNVTDEKAQAELCKRISEQQLSVRETERLVKDLTTQRAPKPARVEVKGRDGNIDPNVRAALDDIAMALGTRVRLHAKTPSSGKLEIEYYSQEDLDRIYSVITKS